MGYTHYLYAIPKKQVAEIQACKTNEDWCKLAENYGYKVDFGCCDDNGDIYDVDCVEPWSGLVNSSKHSHEENNIKKLTTISARESSRRYIDANAAIKSFKNLYIEGNYYTPNFIIEFLEKQSTVDVQEVRHAKWIYKGHHEMMGHAFQCSACERWIFTNSPKHVVGEYPYCHCGAKIDEVEGLEARANERNMQILY